MTSADKEDGEQRTRGDPQAGTPCWQLRGGLQWLIAASTYTHTVRLTSYFQA